MVFHPRSAEGSCNTAVAAAVVDVAVVFAAVETDDAVAAAAAFADTSKKGRCSPRSCKR